MERFHQEIPEASESQAALEREQERLHRALRETSRQVPNKHDTENSLKSSMSEKADHETLEGTLSQVNRGNKAQGDIGEQQAAAIAVQKLDLIGNPDFTPAEHGIDGVYSDPNGKIVVLEAKFTNESLHHALKSSAHGTQMSPEWIEDKAQRMRDVDSALYTPGNARVGVQILDSAPENMRRVTVLLHPGSLEANAYEAMSDGQWHLIGNWSALKGDFEPTLL